MGGARRGAGIGRELQPDWAVRRQLGLGRLGRTFGQKGMRGGRAAAAALTPLIPLIQ